MCIRDRPNEVIKDNGEPYTVFTPYSKKWKTRLGNNEIESYLSEKELNGLIKTDPFSFPELVALGFKKSNIQIPAPNFLEQLISNYFKNRDLPAINGTSKLGVHLRFGTISIREITR